MSARVDIRSGDGRDGERREGEEEEGKEIERGGDQQTEKAGVVSLGLCSVLLYFQGEKVKSYALCFTLKAQMQDTCLVW